MRRFGILLLLYTANWVVLGEVERDPHTRSLSDGVAMQRSSSWPVDNARSKKMMSLSEFDDQGRRILFAPAPAGFCHVPNLFANNHHGGSSDISSDDEMPGTLCGWCEGAECNGLRLKDCLTWCRLHDVLGL